MILLSYISINLPPQIPGTAVTMFMRGVGVYVAVICRKWITANSFHYITHKHTHRHTDNFTIYIMFFFPNRNAEWN